MKNSEYKRCVHCKEIKPQNSEYFYYRNKKRGWFSSWCIYCTKQHKTENRKRELFLQRKRRGSTPCRICGTNKKILRHTYCISCLKKKTREQKRADKCIYRSRLKRATPQWANLKAIRTFYGKCIGGFQVDHIIPLRGDTVSGLHVVENLQYLTIAENLSKSNHYSIEYNRVK